MKSWRLVLILLVLTPLVACEDTDVVMLTGAAVDAVKAVTLSDEDVRELALVSSRSYDSSHTVADSTNPYDRRLRKLVSGYPKRDGLEFNFKVYLTKDINAFAMADGSIRVYSGLMDLMADEELLFVIGHEMGHVIHKHSRKKVVMAYASKAVRKGLGSQNNEIGQIARSIFGGLAESLANAQFSQHEEREADSYGVSFLESEGYSKEGAVGALRKLAELAKAHTILSSHPDPDTRAKRIEQGHINDESDEQSIWDKIRQLTKSVFFFLYGILRSVIVWALSFLG